MLNEHDLKDFDKVQILRNAIRTPDGTLLESTNRHDYQSHWDYVAKELYFVDGGWDYLRRSVNSIPATDLTVTTADPFALQRAAFKWGCIVQDVYGRTMKIHRALCDLTDDHISAILATQFQIDGTFVEELMKQELEYRKQMKKITEGVKHESQ